MQIYAGGSIIFNVSNADTVNNNVQNFSIRTTHRISSENPQGTLLITNDLGRSVTSNDNWECECAKGIGHACK